MQIVIDISDDFIKDCDGNLDCVISLVDYKIDDVYSEEMGYANFKYTELPKGHGRLIDADKLIKKLEATANIEWNMQVGSSKGLIDAIDIVDDTPTIIEADKELEQPDKCKFFKDADCCYPIEDCDNCPNHKEDFDWGGEGD